MSDLVGNPEDCLSHKEAHIVMCSKDTEGMANSEDPD